MLPVSLTLKITAFYAELVGTYFNLNCPGRDHPDYLFDILIRNAWPSPSLTPGGNASWPPGYRERGGRHCLGLLDSHWEGPVCYRGDGTGWPARSALQLLAPEEATKCV